MKILQVNKFWYPKGGADIYCLQLTRELQTRGHEVARFGMQHPDNEPSRWNDYFVSESNYHQDRPTLSAAKRFIYNKEAAEKFQAVIDRFQPDVIHLHNIYHQLTTAILPIARASGAKVVMTAHDYKLIAPNYSLFAAGRITEATKIHQYYRLLFPGASDESLARRVLLATEAYYTWLFKRYQKNIDLVIAPSYFMQKQIHEYRANLPTVVLHNFTESELELNPVPQHERDDFVLYVGRLSAEKGLDTLIESAHLLPEQKYIVIGEGPAAAQDAPENIQWLGYQSRTVVRDYMKRAKALIVPSKWYEVNSLVIPEAHTVGTWVIAANTGSIDVLTDGVDGWWFEMGNSADLAKKITELDTLKQSYTPYANSTVESHIAQLLQYYTASAR